MHKKEALKHINDIFRKFNIQYTLIGAYAVAIWGIARATQDIDFLARIPQEKMSQIIKIFKLKGFKTEVNIGDAKDPIAGVLKLIYTHNKTEEVIDILLGIRKSPDIFKRTKKIDILGLKIPVISPEDLIITKILAGGPLDIEDTKNIINIMENAIDSNYIKTFCKKNNLKPPKQLK